MDLAGILLASILIGGFIAIGTGAVAIVGVLQVLGGAGLRREPPPASGSITERQRHVDARLRARYLERHRTPRGAMSMLTPPEAAQELHEGPAWPPLSPVPDPSTPSVTNPGLA
jgi:hypothetical protein